MTDYKKLYEDAIFRMNKWVEGSEIIDPKEVAELVFPELKESEDERIRKAIHIYLDWLDGRNKDYQPKGDYTIRDMIAWVEKQGEKTIPLEDIIHNVWELGNLWKELTNGVCTTEYGRQIDYIVKHWKEGEHYIKSVEKLCGQKPINKMEPKFKVGNYIINEHGFIMQIDGIDNNKYTYHVLDDNKHQTCDIKQAEKSCHLWTIQDAKDGDVLATNYFIFIFKNIDSNNGVHYYCQYEISKHEDDNQFDTALPESLMGKVGSSHYSPATKEQRDTLMKAMTDAGYTFDFEKKELKKIYNEEVNGEDYGIDGLWHAQRILEKTLGSVDGYQSDKGILRHKCAISTVKKFYEQKPAWSEEDETVLNNLIYALANDIIGNCREEYVDWLKSLKDRI